MENIVGKLSSFLPPDYEAKSASPKLLRENLNDPPRKKEKDTVEGMRTSTAATKLLKSQGQRKIAKRISEEIQNQQIVCQFSKEEKQRQLKEQKEAKRESSVKRMEPIKLPVKMQQEDVDLPKEMPMDMHIQNMEQHNHRAKQVSLFASHVERPLQASTAHIIATPSMEETLKMSRKYPSMKLVTDQYMEMLANNPNIKKQNLPVYRRSTLQEFLYAPDPKKPWQRPCCNLNRPPVQGEQKFQCAGHELSCKLLGPDKAFLPRELLFPDQIVRINHSLDVEGDGDASSHLLPVPQMCYMCYIFLINQLFLEQRNKLDDRERKDHTQSKNARTTMITILNRFIVAFGTEGEYDITRLIASDSLSLGILGPFPLWSPRHYVPVIDKYNDVRGFAEKDIMVFRLSQEPSELIESANLNDSTRSTPTSVKHAATRFRQ